ncbi:MAG: HEAT repeat protein [Planctomycetota bacterium]|jgi:HEAT repeat protein
MMLMTALRLQTLPALLVATMVTAVAVQSQSLASKPVPEIDGQQAPNTYRLKPFQPGFPSKLEYPPMLAREYDKTRRQVLRQLANNLMGNVRREAWQIATEFFWRAPEDAVEPLIEAMDRAMGRPDLADVVRNCAEAMGKMENTEFDGALLRALQHKNPAVRQQAYTALALSGSEKTLKRLVADFAHMDGRSRQAWLGAVGKRLVKERAVLLRSVMMTDYPGPIRDLVLKEAIKLPAAEAAVVLKGRWSEAVDEFKAIIAGVLHAAGDGAGTAWLQQALQGENNEQKQYAIRHCMYGGDPDKVIGVLREDLLRTTTHLRPEIRLAAAKQLTRLSGDDVANTFEVMTAPNEIWEIRGLAVRELTRRGRSEIVSVLLDELETATGTSLRNIINQLSVSGDPRAVPVLVDRFKTSPAGEGRPFLQAIAQNASDDAAKALCKLFAGPVMLVTRSDATPLTTRSYIPLLLLNLRGSEKVVLEYFLALPKDEWELRSRLLSTIVGYAVDRRNQEGLKKSCIDPVRALLMDPSELPQLRVQALNLLARNWLTIDDVMRLQRMRRKELPGMRALLGDFLLDAF